MWPQWKIIFVADRGHANFPVSPDRGSLAATISGAAGASR
jgi:hypothetical protein